MKSFRTSILIGVAAITLVLLPLVLRSTTLAADALTLALAVLGSTLIFGSGLLSFGQALFFGLGSYAAAWLLKEGGWGLLPAVLAAGVVSTMLGALVGALTIRRSGIYFVMLTLAFSNLGFFLAYTAADVTGGENGLLDVPRTPGVLSIFDLNIKNGTVYYAICAVITFACYLAMIIVQRSAFGSVLRAIRQNEQRSIILGYDARIYKIIAFAIAGGLAGIGGALNVGLMHFVSLSNIAVGMSERILVVTLLSGGHSFVGALIASSVFTGLSDVLASLWPRWMMLLGIVIIIIAFSLERPAGQSRFSSFRRLFARSGS